MMKFLIPFLFKIYTIDKEGATYTYANIDMLETFPRPFNKSGINATDVIQVCAGRNHRSYIHVLMVFVWMTFLIPELLKIEDKLWALFNLNTEPPEEEEGAEKKKGATCLELSAKEKEKN